MKTTSIFAYCRQWGEWLCGTEVLRMGVNAAARRKISRRKAE